MSLSDKCKKAKIDEISRFIEAKCDFRYMRLSDLREFPRIKVFYESILDDVKAGKMSFDEAGQVFSYTKDEVIESVFPGGSF